MLDKLTCADFSAHLHSSFHIHVGGHADGTADTPGSLEAELIEVAELGMPPSDPEDAPRRAFSIILRATPDIVLPQRIYPVEHAELGTLDLFLVPLGPDKEGMRYEAIFT
jgi:hypothetical protein